MSSTFRTILAELSDPIGDVGDDTTRHDHSPFHLATLADCYSPDSIDSPGAVFLARIARDVAYVIEPGRDESTADEARARLDDLTDGDGAHEIADSAVPIYTHDRWQVFVDLGAYNEDASDFGEVDGSDLTAAAGVALYMIAARLVRALAEELTEALDEDEDEDETIERADGSVVYLSHDARGWHLVAAPSGHVIGTGPFDTADEARQYLAEIETAQA